jgi:hypothetical protein
MATGQERIDVLETRCSPSAREFLHELRGHPKFSELVSKLEAIYGTLFRGDIEDAFATLVKGPPKNGQE